MIDDVLDEVGAALRLARVAPERPALDGHVEGFGVRADLAGDRIVVDVRIPTTALVLDLRPQAPDESGERIDLEIGERVAPFDDLYVVEAAPSDVARVLLDEALCSWLVRLHPMTLDASGRRLTAARVPPALETAGVLELVRLAVGVAARLPEAFDRANGLAVPRRGETPYRAAAILPPREPVLTAEQRRRELEDLLDLYARKGSR